jgi:response regulator RpfG family c-di-GMP phosphodiesterase
MDRPRPFDPATFDVAEINQWLNQTEFDFNTDTGRTLTVKPKSWCLISECRASVAVKSRSAYARRPRGDFPLLVVVTSWDQDVDRCKALHAGLDLHLTKPFDPRELIHVIAKRAMTLESS